ncbi:hypothetical protein TIFTF001_004922 [Ficus carica]|uniref:Uncharacterized protein n=1 Tax=Ficus carica TaxID=3494 RepID=A0AA87ZWS0_FICCA|nr:hypothetical protein TIFTF001_004922 [Ficus carica]
MYGYGLEGDIIKPSLRNCNRHMIAGWPMATTAPIEEILTIEFKVRSCSQTMAVPWPHTAC